LSWSVIPSWRSSCRQRSRCDSSWTRLRIRQRCGAIRTSRRTMWRWPVPARQAMTKWRAILPPAWMRPRYRPGGGGGLGAGGQLSDHVASVCSTISNVPPVSEKSSSLANGNGRCTSVPVTCPMSRSETVCSGHPRARKTVLDLQIRWSARHDKLVPKLIVRCQGGLDSVLGGASRPAQQLGTATHTPYGHPGRPTTPVSACAVCCEQVRAGSYGSEGSGSESWCE
jgi:hypothetical protein